MQERNTKTILDVEVLYFPEFDRNPSQDRNHGSLLQNQTHTKLKGNVNLIKFIVIFVAFDPNVNREVVRYEYFAVTIPV